MKRRRIYELAWIKYGNLQYVVAIEEMAELTKTLTKHLRGKTDLEAITEEIADVEIMLEQVKRALSIRTKEAKHKKIERLKELVIE